MNQPPLQLNTYFFPIVSITADQEWTPEKSKGKGPPLLNCNVKTAKLENDENSFQVSLEISINSTEENPSQYEVQLAAIGILTARPDLENKEQNMTVTGASILYSASREFLLMIMGRGPWPPVLLNPMSFLPSDGNRKVPVNPVSKSKK